MKFKNDNKIYIEKDPFTLFNMKYEQSSHLKLYNEYFCIKNNENDSNIYLKINNDSHK